MILSSRKEALGQAFKVIHQSRKLATISAKPITSVLIANRGEIALRVGRTAQDLGIRCTTIYTDLDAKSQHALSSPYAVNIGFPSAYLDGEQIIKAAKKYGCEALHPGYGFLSENSTFSRRCLEEGLVFIGPPWEAIEAMGNKSKSKDIMIKAGVPCVPGYHGSNQEPQFLLNEARNIGFPVMIKAVKGGGGKGMRICTKESEFLGKLQSAKMEAINAFGDDIMLIEKYIVTPRHVEVQVFGDKYGNIVTMGERDCSLQRRHQKIIEEAPAPNLALTTRENLWEKARAAALAVGYEGAGTVEFILDNDTKVFYFMEMNTRLQVEHSVTEAITGEDLVSWQFKIAAGEPLPLNQNTINQRIKDHGCAIEARIYAEKPDQNFMPDSGKIIYLKTPKISRNVRIDSGFVAGDTISAAYDGMISKLIVKESTRILAIQKLYAALQEYEVAGLNTNIEFLQKICQSPAFIQGDVETGYIQKFQQELFTPGDKTAEDFIQAALGLLANDLKKSIYRPTEPHGLQVGFGFADERQYIFHSPSNTAEDRACITLSSIGYNRFSISANYKNFTKHYENVVCEHRDTSITTFFPHTRIDSTVVIHENTITIFQHGRKIQLRVAAPSWKDKALGSEEIKNSVLAPMPCKVLRNEVKEGDMVEKNQPLLVIESMKMETVIRSPHRGIITKLAHKEGDICKAGTVLVLFEEVEHVSGKSYQPVANVGVVRSAANVGVVRSVANVGVVRSVANVGVLRYVANVGVVRRVTSPHPTKRRTLPRM
ncbi:Methylcrotonoyl-CoA carboxylase subunit alpha [Podosphaera aphanis]|nr:Methylcrotonoyl-CoA carboxylase subunit alpha [Podosphaera aphanis]